MTRSSSSSLLLVLFGALCACGAGDHSRSRSRAPRPGPTADATDARPRSAARRLTEETTLTTHSGASLRAPKDWWVTEEESVILLEDPDRALKSWLVESKEADGERAVALAWQRVAPGAPGPTPSSIDAIPPTGGWDAITSASYEAAGESRVVEAVARRHGDTTYVSLIDADPAALSRRRAQIEQARESLRPKGLRAESFVGLEVQAIDDARAKALDAFIAEALERLQVPGATVAIVRGNAVVYERSFGVRELGKKAPVTPSTLFMIGSITKPMTTMMQAALVDAGTFDWETPVVSVLPSFALGDADLTRRVAMWHMSCACTGMPRRDFEHIFEFENVSAEQRIASMKSMKPTTALGETFQYSNLMVAAGGFAAAHAYAPDASFVSGYQAAMRAKVFEPIGMKSTTTDFSAALRKEHALPHATAIDGTVRPIPVSMERNVIPIAPAGAVWSSLRDMERYVMTEMSGGITPAGKRVVSEKNLKIRRTPRTGDAATGGYGLGLGVETYHGLPAFGHDGGAFGFGTTMFVLPEQQIAILVLTNVRSGAPTEHLPFNAVVKRRAVEALFSGAKPLAAAQLEYFTKGKARANARAVEQVQRVPDLAQMKRLTGTYTHESLGAVTLTVGDGKTVIDGGEWKSSVGQRRGDDGPRTLVFLDPPFAGSEWTVGGDEANPTLAVTDGQVSFVFRRNAKR